jgi:hypothetical protein
MSGRPSAPFSWATSIVNYPAVDPTFGVTKDWSSLPIRTAPAIDYVTPAKAFAAEEFNYVLGKATDTVAAVVSQVGNLAANNWHTVRHTTFGQVFSINRLVWDGFTKTIRMCNTNVGGANPGEITAVSYDGGRTFIAHPTDTHGVSTLAAAWNPSTGTHVFCTLDSTPAVGTVPTGVDTGDWSVANATWFTAGSVLVTAGHLSGTQKLQSVSGTTLTSRAAQVPVNMFTGATDVILAQSSTTLLLFGNNVTASGGNNYLSTTDGITYTTRTSPISGSYKVVAALHDGAVFVLMTSDGTGTKVYTSATGTGSWSLVATLTTLAVRGAASSGSCIAATMYDGTRQRMYVSSNAGVTWTPKGNWGSDFATDLVFSVADGEGFATSGGTGSGAASYAVSNVTG